MRAAELLLLAESRERDVLDVAIRLLTERFGYWTHGILLYDPAKEELAIVAAGGPYAESTEALAFRTKPGHGLIGASALSRRLVNAPDVSRDPRYIRVLPEVRSEIDVPIVSRDELLGVLMIESTKLAAFDARDEAVLTAFAQLVALALTAARAHEAQGKALDEAQRLAITDELTGFYNARHFTRRLAEEVERAKRYEHPLALLLIDSDSLKQVNDTLGHEAGNRLLVELARRIRENVRATDIAARFGGDEFLILAPETRLAEAVLTGERIRAAASHDFAVEGEAPIAVHVSCGVAALPETADGGEALFRQADAALYQAKHLGKDRVVAAPTVKPAP